MSGQGKRARVNEGADHPEDEGDTLLGEASLKQMLHGATADLEKRLQDAMDKVSKNLQERMDNQLAALEAKLEARLASLGHGAVGPAPAPHMAFDKLPKRVILLRHGQSEGNADNTIYRTCPDCKIELTDEGTRQAMAAGDRIKKLIGEETLDVFVSPFQRTLQTLRNAIMAFGEGQVQRVTIDPRIREQEFGNLQGDDFKNFREEQTKVGRFWYRFPTGESGADVYDRSAAWWQQEILSNNPRIGKGLVDNVLVVTHGLTMRLILMQLFGWSPDTFHTVWNADNCSVYVLKYDGSLPSGLPYRLDIEEGDCPRATKEITVRFKDGQEKAVVLRDYLSIPQPRTEQREFVLRMIEDQHGIPAHDVAALDFFPESKKFR